MNINVFCSPFGIEGYSIHAADLLRALHADGMDVACVLPPPLTGTHPDPIIQEAIMRGRRARATCVGVKLDLAEPQRVATFSGRPRIFYTMSEVDRLPPSWVEALNTVDEVWTPSAWGRAVFMESGVERPVRVVPEAVDTTLFEATAPVRQASRPYRFLTVGKFEERKNYAGLFRAYVEEFDADEQVELVVCFGHELTGQANPFEFLFNLNLGRRHPPIEFLPPITTRTAMAALYRSAEAFVLPTRGEGWCLPVMEAMSSALPVITTGIGPILEYATNETALLLGHELVPARDPQYEVFHEYFKWGRWAEPSIAELRHFMRQLFQNPAAGRALGLRAGDEVRMKWTWPLAVAKVREALAAAGVDTR